MVTLDWLVIAGYFAVVAGLALRVIRQSNDTSADYFLAGHSLGWIVHTHSLRATALAQARREIPCLGTTHTDHFYGPVPLTRPLTDAEVQSGYEVHTGEVIVERFAELDPLAIPAVLVAGHAPFAWGSTPAKAVQNAAALEAVAQMALDTFALDPDVALLEAYVMEQHYTRKHGAGAYYGQGEQET